WPPGDDARYGHLQLGNDCSPCCDCEDYIAVAEYTNGIRAQYAAVGTRPSAARDSYHATRARRMAAAACREQRPLRIQLVAQICPFVDIAVQYCNQTGECHRNVQLSVATSTTPGGGIGSQIPGYTFVTGASVSPRGKLLTERYLMG